VSKLTEFSRGVYCIRCDKPDAYSCHYNGVRQYLFGKGRGIKCNDLMTAEFCFKCDQIFSEGSKIGFIDNTDRSEEFLFFISMTNIRRLNNGVLKV